MPWFLLFLGGTLAASLIARWWLRRRYRDVEPDREFRPPPYVEWPGPTSPP